MATSICDNLHYPLRTALRVMRERRSKTSGACMQDHLLHRDCMVAGSAVSHLRALCSRGRSSTVLIQLSSEVASLPGACTARAVLVMLCIRPACTVKKLSVLSHDLAKLPAIPASTLNSIPSPRHHPHLEDSPILAEHLMK